MDFRNIHMGIDAKNRIFFGLVTLKKNGLFSWKERCNDDRTDEAINVVARRFKHSLDDREDGRPYVGYEIPKIGKIVLIKSGYNFACYKETEKKPEIPNVIEGEE